jgi:hypothetical protein
VNETDSRPGDRIHDETHDSTALAVLQVDSEEVLEVTRPARIELIALLTHRQRRAVGLGCPRIRERGAPDRRAGASDCQRQQEEQQDAKQDDDYFRIQVSMTLPA